MLPPQKPWETGTVNQRSLPAVSNSDVLQSSPGNLGPQSGATNFRPNVRNPPPPPPPRPRQAYQGGLGLGYSGSGSSYSGYSSPFSSYGGYGNAYSNYSNYGYGGFGNYGTYGSYGGYGGYGFNRMGFQQGMPESRFIQMAEDGTRPAFQSIESLVRAFGSVTFMLESTFNAMYSSFRAVLGVAENFGRLRALFGQFVSVFAVFRWLQWLYKKCLYLLGLSRYDPGRDNLWRQASQGVVGEMGGKMDSEGQRTSWPVMLFLGIILSGPYLMWKLLSSIEIPNIDPYNMKEWSKCKEPGYSAIVLFDFVAGSPQELNLRAGQRIIIAPKDCQQNQNWLFACGDGKRVGLVPANYIKRVARVIFQNQKMSRLNPEPLSNVVPESEMAEVTSNEVETEAIASSGILTEGDTSAEVRTRVPVAVPEPNDETAKGSVSTEPSNNLEKSE